MTTFFATLTPMLTLFFCIALGFIFTKMKVLPESAGKTLAKTETWIFCPALSLMTMVRFCTVDSLSVHGTNVLLSCIGVSVAMAIAVPLSHLFVKENSSERGVYAYALAFANSGYMGDPIVLALFGEEALAYYKIFCLPITIVIYTWGIRTLTPKSEEKWAELKRLLNAPTLAMLFGMLLGLSGLGRYLPDFITSALDSLKVCMGPVAMLLAGVTIAKYDFFSIIKDRKVYLASILRLTLIPACLITVLFGVKTLANSIFSMSIGHDVLFFCFFATGTPLGMNTVIFPEAYGGNPKTGASMALISHTLCVLTIPLFYAALVFLFGLPF